MEAPVLLTIMGVYFAILIGLSRIVGRKAGSQAFYTGDRKSPWYVVAFGMIGTTISGVTFISVPGEVGNTAFHYFQFVLGNFVGYMIIANALLPFYYKKNVVSIYSVLEQKMGRNGYLTSSGFFIFSKLIGSGFRLYLAALVIQMAVSDALGIPFGLTVLICLVVIWLYTFRTGIKTVVWSDTLQTVVLIAAVIATLVILTHQLNTGIFDIGKEIRQMPESRIFEWNFSSPNNFFKQFVSGILVTLAINGFDQDIIQKNLTCKNSGQARKNMMWFSLAFVVVVFLFLILGAMLYKYARTMSIAIPSQSDQLYPFIALKQLGGIAGILFILGVTAAAFSSADSATTSLTTAFCIDFLKIEKYASKIQTKYRTLVHLSFSFVLFVIIMAFHSFNNQSVVVSIFKAAGYTYGPILGLYTFLFTISRQPKSWAILPVCVLSPVLTWLFTWFLEFYFKYQFGFEIIVVNAAICLILLVVFSKKSVSVKKV